MGWIKKIWNFRFGIKDIDRILDNELEKRKIKVEKGKKTTKKKTKKSTKKKEIKVDESYTPPFRIFPRYNLNVSRIVTKIVTIVITLYVGGTIMQELGNVMNGTTSPFYQGLSLIGWTVNDAGTITGTSGSGILAVIGIIGIASIVTEFVRFRI